MCVLTLQRVHTAEEVLLTIRLLRANPWNDSGLATDVDGTSNCSVELQPGLWVGWHSGGGGATKPQPQLAGMQVAFYPFPSLCPSLLLCSDGVWI